MEGLYWVGDRWKLAQGLRGGQQAALGVRGGAGPLGAVRCGWVAVLRRGAQGALPGPQRGSRSVGHGRVAAQSRSDAWAQLARSGVLTAHVGRRDHLRRDEKYVLL